MAFNTVTLPSTTLRIFALILFLFSSGCYHQSYSDLTPGKEISMSLTTFSFDKPEHPYNRFPLYKIMPGDVLDVLYQVSSWQKHDTFKLASDHTITVKFPNADELSQTQKVRPDGKISLPYVGDIYVIGKTPEDLAGELKIRYAKTLQSTEIMVLVPEFRASILDFKNDLHTAPRGLSRLATVRPDGYVTFPMIGDVLVAEKTIPEVRKILNEKYEEILPDLHCDLFLEHHAGSVIYVTGQVKTPGAYMIPRPITALEAITLAGGTMFGARLDGIIVVRKHENNMVATRVDLSKTMAFSSKSQFFYLQPNDIVVVPTTWITQAADISRTISDIVMFRGWSGSVGANAVWNVYNAGTSVNPGFHIPFP